MPSLPDCCSGSAMPEATAQQPQQRQRGRQSRGGGNRGGRGGRSDGGGRGYRGTAPQGNGGTQPGAGIGAEILKLPTPSQAEDTRAAIFEGACEEVAMGRCRRCLDLLLRLCPYDHMRVECLYIWNERGSFICESCKEFTNKQPCLPGSDEHGVSSGSNNQCFADAKSLDGKTDEQIEEQARADLAARAERQKRNRPESDVPVNEQIECVPSSPCLPSGHPLASWP